MYTNACLCCYCVLGFGSLFSSTGSADADDAFLWIDMIVWDKGPMSRSGLATTRCGTFPFMLLKCYVNEV